MAIQLFASTIIFSFLFCFLRTKTRKSGSPAKSPRKGKSPGKKVVVKKEPVYVVFTFETLDKIEYYHNDPTPALDAKKKFVKENPGTVFRIGTYKRVFSWHAHTKTDDTLDFALLIFWDLWLFFIF